MIFGYLLSLDLCDCDPDIIKTKGKLIQYVRELCAKIDMKRYGPALVKWFGSGSVKGYSIVQLIETSSIVGHFSEETGAGYIDVFSCKPYDASVVENFTQEFFKAGSVRATYLVR